MACSGVKQITDMGAKRPTSNGAHAEDDRRPASGQGGDAPQKPGAARSLAAPDMLGDALKAYYDTVVAEPIPERFLELLKALEDK